LLPVAPAGSAGAGAVPAAAGGFSASRVAGFFTTGISSYTVRASFCAASRAAGSVLTTATGTSPNARLSRSTSVSSSPGPTGRTPRSQRRLRAPPERARLGLVEPVVDLGQHVRPIPRRRQQQQQPVPPAFDLDALLQQTRPRLPAHVPSLPGKHTGR
jgi:hypothetical protein